MSDRNSSLDEYRRKRDFAQTTEPSDQTAAPRKGKALSFVVQKHAARALHYDFRLELDGTLKSWAVPKGPSLDPHDKRMAVQVEDHPIAYGSFEGTIPPGQYGAGTVIVWDRGTWTPIGDARAGYRDGKLKFELKGEKLQGLWTLVRMRGKGSERQQPWLLIKERDTFARPAAEYSVVDAEPDSVVKTRRKAQKTAFPLMLAPQLATLVRTPPASGNWCWEMKFDGYRLLARADADGDVRLFTRNGHDWTSKLKALAQAIEALKLKSSWLDGEIVIQGEHGAPDFQALQNAFEVARTAQIVYYLFDLPFHAGEDLRGHPLVERRERLRTLLDDDESKVSPRLRFSEDFHAEAAHLLASACRLRMEGLIGKRADSPYQSSRSPDWIKLKCTQRQEFVIVGHTDPKGSRAGLGSLLLAVHDDAGTLRYTGNVGAGFSEASLRKLKSELDGLAVKTAAFEGTAPKGAHFVKPKLVAEVSFAEWTKEGRVRQAVFHGLRGDKPPAAITREKPAAAPKTATKNRSKPTVGRLTHPERVIDPSTGITKLEVAEFYAAVAPRLLPHLKHRPVSLVRGPDGVDGALFFQKHGDTLRIPGLKQLDPALDPGHPPLLEIPTRTALLGAVQMNVLELHTWNATSNMIEKPDRICFDLDPGEGVAWPRVQEAVTLVRTMLDELALQGFLKTSGGKGLHIVVPFRRGPGWEAVKGLSQAIVQHLAETLPKQFVAKSGPKNRVGKIFVDYLRNGRGATTVAAWSARARPGMGVSVPVTWDELPTLTGGAHWTIRSIDARLAEPDKAWDGYEAARKQTLTTAMRVLDYLPDGT
ncbi:DNA ligase D [Paucibacter sp. R3-3]|uniref:DNA ligase (ATP) n=1 Tax=Roseateles agri TaxID=3098619 RepID=A0ABU5DQL8_9BURK|nr:DNA ligase D [Paucibacter sp. R3-3]MDY0748615.1 DNA ligase D [Paucibacter sp. R3-3]